MFQIKPGSHNPDFTFVSDARYVTDDVVKARLLAVTCEQVGLPVYCSSVMFLSYGRAGPNPTPPSVKEALVHVNCCSNLSKNDAEKPLLPMMVYRHVNYVTVIL